jgi:iron(III) transport system substrate-binding protein
MQYRMTSSIARLARVIAAALLLLAAPARGALSATGPVDDPDLVAKAHVEGTVSYYAGLSESQLTAIVARWRATYPKIAIQTLRASPLTLLTRAVTEQQAGHYVVDVMDDAGLEIDQLKRQGMLVPYRLPDRAEFLTGTVDPDGYWAAIFLNSEVIAYNPQRLRALSLQPPSTWDALAAPQWRGNFGLPSESYEWWDALTKFFGKAHADAIARGYAANNPQLTSSHTLAVNSVVTGELPAAANVYGYYALEQQDSGKPIAFVNPTPTILEDECIAVFRTAPHPNAGRLFARWFLSRDTQRWVRSDLKRISARKDVKNDPRLLDPKVRYVISNPDDSPNAAALVKAFKVIFNIPV